VVGAPAGQNLLVLAPPGTGKTYTLLRRICHLLQNGNLQNPFQELVVLSFTRAAVGTVVERVIGDAGKDLQASLRFVNVRTFDSFATRVLLKDLPPDKLPTGGYEERIRHFTQLLKKDTLGPEARLDIDAIRHLIVDEVQDLVSARAAMTLALARRVVDNGGSVLMLGDLHQSIYDYQVPAGDPMTSTRFLAEAREILGSSRLEVELDRYYRYADDRMKTFVANARQAMGPDGRDPDGYKVLDLLEGLGPAAPLSDIVQAAGREGESIALLTRTNLEVFQLSQWCASRALRHDVRRGAGGAYWPGWIARLTLGYKETSLGTSLAAARWKKLIGTNGPTFDTAMAFLGAQGVVERDRIDLAGLCRKIRTQAPTVPPRPAGASQLVVSTIHRSKGMEFDRVYVLEPGRNSSGDPEEVRILYVAGTRARAELRLLNRDRSVFRSGGKRGELTHFHLYDRKSGLNQLLLADGLDELDVESLLTPWSGAAPVDPVIAVTECQRALWEAWVGGQRALTAVRAGDGYDLVLPRDPAGGAGGGTVCQLAASLCKDLRALGRMYRSSLDGVVEMSRVSVVDMATVALPAEENPDAARRLGAACLALAPVVYGQAALEMI
jgi:DNA helicase-2/ATP-dependent DNA helicase PcrA